ncbi:MAG TPA: AAA family ATPase [Methanobacteriaceae archaeon]|nr:AAA family ATPase [Methanobacteriaceae archaeon]
MIITIGGLAGTGTSTAASILSEKMGIPYLSAGDIFREMAREKGMDILSFSEFAEGNTDIDREIDQRQAHTAQESENLIVEGRLSAHFVEADLRVWLNAPFAVRSVRISQREDKPVELVREEILIREKSEAKRYQEIHNLDIAELEIYDLIINTASFPAESVAEIIEKAVEVI